MKVTLDLDHIQLTILHALIGESSNEATAKAVVTEAQEYSYMNEDIARVYKRTLAYISNHPTHVPFGYKLGELFEAIDDAMTECGRTFKEE